MIVQFNKDAASAASSANHSTGVKQGHARKSWICTR